MEVFDPIEYKNMVKEYQKNNKPLDWFDTIYKSAQGDYRKVFWADLEPSPYLIDWLENNKIKKSTKKAIVVGCGVGDDAEALSKYDFDVTAFDISPSAIELCKKRYPNSKVNYLVANLFEYDNSWFQNFDLVYECNTIQVLPGDYRIKARIAISNLVCKEGYVLVSCRSREENKQLDDIPLPLDKKEIEQFIKSDALKEISFLSYDDNQIPSVPHFFAVYKREK
jgi:2-polyprenyl-3-methyl-5-hydroxy-6-metoxy-1,4-benzoquinol methylase